MEIQAFGYLGVGTTKLDDWTSLATGSSGWRRVIEALGPGRFAWTIAVNV